MSDGWRLTTVFREALANLASSGISSALLGVALGGMFGALFWAELAFSSAVKAEVHRFQAAGGDVAVVDGPNGLDAARCERLRWDRYVVGAGGFRDSGQVTAATSPGVSFARWEVTGDIVRIWDRRSPPMASAGYFVGNAAAAELGLGTGAWLHLDDLPSGRVTVVEPAGRNEFAARAILEPQAPTGRLAQCWVEFSPGAMDAGVPWLAAHFAADEALVRRAVARGEFGIDPAAMIAQRPQRWGWLPVAILGTAVLTLVASFRRSDTAVYRAFGLRRLELLIMQQVETAVLVSAAVILGALWAAALHSIMAGLPGLDQVSLALRTTLTAAALTTIIGPVSATLAASGSPAALLKER